MSVFRVTTRAHSGDFDGEAVAWDVLHRAGEHASGPLAEIDLSACVMLRPYSIACLVALGAAAKLNGRSAHLRAPTNPDCARYVDDLNLSRWFGRTVAPPGQGRSSMIEVRQLTERDPRFSDDVVQVLTEGLSYPVGMSGIIANHLDELTLNALTHSQSRIGCVVAGQAYPKNQEVEIAVLDLGQTIRGHLTKNPRHANIDDDASAIERATEEGVTGTVGRNQWDEPNSGSGLYELRRFCLSGRAQMTVLSGNNYLCFGTQERPSVHEFRGGFAGCLVNVKFLTC